MKCTSCEYDGKMKPTTEKHSVKLGERVVAGTVPARACPKCGEVFIEGEDLRAFERAVAEAVLRSGTVDGTTFRFLRHVAELQAKELAPLLGTTPETISRWENGKLDVPRATWLALALLVADRADGRDRADGIVSAASSPKSLPKTIRVA